MKADAERPPRGDEIVKLVASGRAEDAFQKCRALAETGLESAQVWLGWLYETGTGTLRNPTEARRWYETAVRAGSVVAQHYLAHLFRSEGESQSAVDWFAKAAARDHLPSLYQLGMMYAEGDGIAADPTKAMFYMTQAAEHGHLFAKRWIATRMIRERRYLKGLLMALNAGTKGFWLALTNQDDERLRW